MDVSCDMLDIEQFEAQKIIPAVIVNRKSGENWLVLDLPLNVDAPASEKWGTAASGDAVRVPLFPYLAGSLEPAHAMAFAFELGFRASQMAGHAARHLHIAVGKPIQETGEHLRFWIGFALII